MTNEAFPPEISDTATSIGANSNETIDRCSLIAEILNEFENIYRSLDEREYMEEYRKRSCIIKGIDIIR